MRKIDSFQFGYGFDYVVKSGDLSPELVLGPVGCFESLRERNHFVFGQSQLRFQVAILDNAARPHRIEGLTQSDMSG
jgi:hypothetical protein